MYNLENKISNSIKKPSIYLRYVDDILILTNDTTEINILQDTYPKHSVFRYTWTRQKQ